VSLLHRERRGRRNCCSQSGVRKAELELGGDRRSSAMVIDGGEGKRESPGTESTRAAGENK
jgi:hypothetical protein